MSPHEIVLAFDVNVYECKLHSDALKALGMFFRPSIRARVKRIYAKGDLPRAKAAADDWAAKMKKEFPAYKVDITNYTEADKLRRAQYKADAGPVKIKATKEPKADPNAEIKQLLTLLLQKLA